MKQGIPVHCELRVSAVSYLNTWPLVWGFLSGPQRGLFDFRFDLPAVCADTLERGDADIGLVPCAELDRLGLDFLPNLGIASEGPVRSILLISKRPFSQIRTLAADSGSRTSVALTRILLAERYGCHPQIESHVPDLHAMLKQCDAALVIGDPALRLNPTDLPYEWLDLGAEWTAWTSLPMVFAVWGGRREAFTQAVAEAFDASYRWGLSRIDAIVERAATERGFPAEMTRGYLTKHIVYELSDRHLEGLKLFRKLARICAEVGK